METNMKFKTWFDEESGILRSEVYKTLEAESVAAFIDGIFSYTEEQQRYLMIFLGENAQGIVDKEARRTVREKGSQNKWEKIAVYGAKPGLRMLAKIMVTAFGRAKNTKFFTEEKEALDWLKAEIEKDKAAKKTG